MRILKDKDGLDVNLARPFPGNTQQLHDIHMASQTTQGVELSREGLERRRVVVTPAILPDYTHRLRSLIDRACLGRRVRFVKPSE